MSEGDQCKEAHSHGDTWKTKAKATCNVLCYCRTDTPSRQPRTPKLAWTPSRLLLLHVNNNKPAEKFEEIISKLQEKHPGSSPSPNSNQLSVPEGEMSRRGSLMGERRLSTVPDGGKQSVVPEKRPLGISGMRRKRKQKRRLSKTPTKSDLYERETVMIE